MRLLIVTAMAAIGISSIAEAKAPTPDDVFAYLQALNDELPKAMEARKSGDLQGLSRQSKQFTALAERGKVFGTSMLEKPYGSCYGTGVALQSWWQAQVQAVSAGNKAPVQDVARDAWNTFRDRQASCMKAAGIE